MSPSAPAQPRVTAHQLGVIVCPWGDCTQPATTAVVLHDRRTGRSVVLEWCARHAVDVAELHGGTIL